MPKIYCDNPQCGAATEYSVSIPKFCAACGTAFGSSFRNTKPTTPTKPKITVSRGDEEEDEGSEYIPEVEKLDVEIQISPEEPVKFANEYKRGKQGVARTEETAPAPYKKPSKKKRSVQQFLQQQITKKNVDAPHINE